MSPQHKAPWNGCCSAWAYGEATCVVLKNEGGSEKRKNNRTDHPVQFLVKTLWETCWKASQGWGTTQVLLLWMTKDAGSSVRQEFQERIAKHNLQEYERTQVRVGAARTGNADQFPLVKAAAIRSTVLKICTLSIRQHTHTGNKQARYVKTKLRPWNLVDFLTLHWLYSIYGNLSERTVWLLNCIYFQQSID